ncbi:MAG TPA: COX15/CtaA family protein [Spirochaetia bacterium]|nr:COX15/CtaA family protein [Spirochaetia bacterium]
MIKSNPNNPSERGKNTQQPPNTGKEKRTWAINRFSLITAAVTFVLIIIGALVSSNGAGSPLPEWPLSLRQLLPGGHLFGVSLYEYLHKLVAGITALLVLALFLWILVGERRAWVKWVGALALVLVIVQAGLGLLQLRMHGRDVMAITLIHAFVAQVFLGVVVSLTVFTSPGWVRAGELRAGFQKAQTPIVYFITTAATAALLIQVLLGAAYSRNLVGVVPHLAGAIVTATLIVWGTILVVHLEHERDRAFPYLTVPARIGIWVLMFELAVGLLSYFFGAGYVGDSSEPNREIIASVIHTAFASALLVTEVTLQIRLYRMVPITEGRT